MDTPTRTDPRYYYREAYRLERLYQQALSELSYRRAKSLPVDSLLDTIDDINADRAQIPHRFRAAALSTAFTSALDNDKYLGFAWTEKHLQFKPNRVRYNIAKKLRVAALTARIGAR